MHKCNSINVKKKMYLQNLHQEMHIKYRKYRKNIKKVRKCQQFIAHCAVHLRLPSVHKERNAINVQGRKTYLFKWTETAKNAYMRNIQINKYLSDEHFLEEIPAFFGKVQTNVSRCAALRQIDQSEACIVY